MNEQKKCEECFANYTGDHDCDGLMKMLVKHHYDKIPPHDNKTEESWELPKIFKFIPDEFPDFEEDLKSYVSQIEASAYKKKDDEWRENIQKILDEWNDTTGEKEMRDLTVKIFSEKAAEEEDYILQRVKGAVIRTLQDLQALAPNK